MNTPQEKTAAGIATTKVPAPARAAPKVKAKVAAPVGAANKPAEKIVLPGVTKAPAKTRAKPAAKAIATSTPLVAKPSAKPTAPAKAAKPAVGPAKAAPAKTAVNAVSDKASKEVKPSGKKPKLVRDSFTFPAVDYALFGSLKQRALKSGHEVKKSELLRAGLAALAELSDAALLKAVQAINRLKPGRPAK